MKHKLLTLVGVFCLCALSASGCESANAGPPEVIPAEPRGRSLSVELREGDTHQVALDNDPASDCDWDVEFSEAYLELIGRASDEEANQEVFTFRARRNGVTEAYFSCTRPHEVFLHVTIGADPALAETMSETEAREIAETSECGEAGDLKQSAFYNDWTATWWIDLDAEKEGCNPACVVDVRTGKAEINWRCTGVLAPADAE
jgi:hypothetical protein